MTYPSKAPRSVRRAYSRDEARERTTIGIKGFRDGGYPAEIVWKKHVPEHPTTSGKARRNHKRNLRETFWREWAFQQMVQITEDMGLYA